MKKINVLISFVEVDNAWELADCGDSFGFITYAFHNYDRADAQDVVIDNPDGWCYNMAVASYHDMLDEYYEYEEVLFKAFIASQIHIDDDEEAYTIIKSSRDTFLVKFYQAYDKDEDSDLDEDDIVYINDKPYVDTEYRKAYWFTDLRFTDKDTTEPEDVEGKICEAFEKYDEEYFEEY